MKWKDKVVHSKSIERMKRDAPVSPKIRLIAGFDMSTRWPQYSRQYSRKSTFWKDTVKQFGITNNKSRTLRKRKEFGRLASPQILHKATFPLSIRWPQSKQTSKERQFWWDASKTFIARKISIRIIWRLDMFLTLQTEHWMPTIQSVYTLREKHSKKDENK